MRILFLLVVLLPAVVGAQAQERVFYYPRPIERAADKATTKSLTRFADLKARNQGKTSWREPIINDRNSLSFMVQEPAGTKHERRLYPEADAWFVVLDGAVRFEVEQADRTFQKIDATKGSFVFVPERMLYSFEVAGGTPAIWYEVTTGPSATAVYETKPSEAPKGMELVPVRVTTGPNTLDVRNEGANGKPLPHHFNVYDLQKQNADKRGFTQEAMRGNRARGNFICGYRPEPFPAAAANRGHLHTDVAESAIVLLGELRWVFEGDEKNAAVAHFGDVIYAAPAAFHIPQNWGTEGLNCGLTNGTSPALNHLFDAK